MRKSHRDGMSCYKGGGQIVSGDDNDPSLGRSKKINTPAEELYLGKSDARRVTGEEPRTRKHHKHETNNHEYEGEFEHRTRRHNKHDADDYDYDYEDEFEHKHKSKPKIHAKEQHRQQRIVISIENEQPNHKNHAHHEHHKSGNWIQGAIKRPGALHVELGISQGKNIPSKTLHRAEHSNNPTLAKQARLAETLKSFHHRGSKR